MKKKEKKEEKCETCKYFNMLPGNKCNRYPNPELKSKQDWCGEYVEK